MPSRSFFSGKRVLLTGHSGFKGSWMCAILDELGADTYGYSLEPPTDPSLFDVAGIGDICTTETGDVRDLPKLKEFYRRARPDVVIHMAAQPIVRIGYRDPVTTYETNVMGTVNVLECARTCGMPDSLLNVTTDKVYRNNETGIPFRETEPLDGFDPYSNSKSCSELVTASYSRSFFQDAAVSTARAGNVIGGGDFAPDRIVPDCIRAAMAGRPVVLRNPGSVRPYQHVLEPLTAYLDIIERQSEDHTLSGSYNVGPLEEDCVTTGQLAEIFCTAWGEGASYICEGDSGPHEAGLLRLDIAKIRKDIGFEPRWRVREAVGKTVEWAQSWMDGEDMLERTRAQIREYGAVVR